MEGWKHTVLVISPHKYTHTHTLHTPVAHHISGHSHKPSFHSSIKMWDTFGAFLQQIYSLSWSQEKQPALRASSICAVYIWTYVHMQRITGITFSPAWTPIPYRCPLPWTQLYLHHYTEEMKEILSLLQLVNLTGRATVGRHKHAAWKSHASLCQLHVRREGDEKEVFSPRGNKECHPAPLKWEPAQRDLLKEYLWLHF